MYHVNTVGGVGSGFGKHQDDAGGRGSQHHNLNFFSDRWVGHDLDLA